MESRADTIALLLFITVAFVIPAVLVAQHFVGVDTLSLLRLGPSRFYIGVAFAVLAFATMLLNVYLSYIAPWLHLREHGDLQEYSHVSGLPVIGGFFVLFAGMLIPASQLAGILLIGVYLADTGGLPWFLAALWRQRND